MIEGLCQKISTDNLDKNLIVWIETQANQYELKYLLAHAEDGVIWGKIENNKLITAKEVFCQANLPLLRLETLQQCRIFGEKGEVLLWRKDNDWKARVIKHLDSWKLVKEEKVPGGKYKCFKIPDMDNDLELIEEHQILWGTKGEAKDGFTFISDGSEGLKHAVPLTGITFNQDGKNLYPPVRLLVHHYIDYDDFGIAKIVLSRLVDLTTQKEDNDKNDAKK